MLLMLFPQKNCAKLVEGVVMAEAAAQKRSYTDPRPYFNELSAADKRALMRRKFAEECRFHKDFRVDMVDMDCSPYAETMRSEVIRILTQKGVNVPGGRLENLHEHISPELKRYGFNDGVNQVSTLLYDTDDSFMWQYHRMIKECVRKYFNYPLYFQAIPTIRIHCPDGENNHHYPRYHTDINYGHPPEEINIWIPLTEPAAPQQHGFRMMQLNHSQAVLDKVDYDFPSFIEKAVNDKAFNTELNQYAPQVATPLGKMFVFDSRCIHTAEPMLHHTRASIDIRILPVDDFNNSEVLYQGVGRRKIRYLPGEAYSSLVSAEL
jgi:hypothetical protein